MATAKYRRRDTAPEAVSIRTIIEHVLDGIVLVDDQGIVRFANPAAVALFGRSTDELVGSDFGFPVIRGETAEIDIVRRGGGVVTAELRVTTVEWEGQSMSLVSMRDISERKQAEEQARALEREQAARAIAELAAQRGRFLADLAQLLARSMVVQNMLAELADLLVPRLADWCLIELEDAQTHERRMACRHVDERRTMLLHELDEGIPALARRPLADSRDGSARVFEAWIEPGRLSRLAESQTEARVLAELGTRAVLSVPLIARSEELGSITIGRSKEPFTFDDRDLAEDVAQRAALALSNARLYEASQLADRAKAEFLAVMSHELRTPLNAITGYADLLEAEVSGAVNDAQREQIGRIKVASRHLQEIIEEILTFSRAEAGKEIVHCEKFDLRRVVREVVALIEPLASQKSIRLVVNVPDEELRMHSDAGKIRQVLYNLLSNAVKFTERGRITVDVVARKDGYSMRVVDSGIGILPEHIDRIFEPFWQVRQSVRRAVGGTGLGLTVSKRLCEILGGSLRVRSTPGRGTTFIAVLPRRAPGIVERPMRRREDVGRDARDAQRARHDTPISRGPHTAPESAR